MAHTLPNLKDPLIQRGNRQVRRTMNAKRLSGLCMVALFLLGYTGANAQYFNVPMTGYTADIVADGTTAAGGAASLSTTSDVDGTGNTGYVFIANDFTFNGTACGAAANRLPMSGQIVSNNTTNNTGITYQLQGYGNGTTTNNNSLRLAAGASGTLTSVTPFQASRLYVVGLSGNAAVPFTVLVTYTDATTETVTGSPSVPDWCGGAALYKLPNATSPVQYFRNTRSATACSGGTCQFLYEIPVTLSAAALTRSIASLTFTNGNATGNTVLHIMAVGAQAPCAPPTAQATGLSLTPASTGSINGSFTAAAPAPAGYLVVRYPSGATVTNPTLSYTAGNTIGAGTVVYSGTGTTFTATGLNGATTYDFYVYSYATGATCGGPVYNTVAPLTGSATTNACGTMSGTVAVGPGLPNTYPGGFTSLTNALAYITANGLGGNTILELQAGYNGTSANETFPITFPVNPCINASKTLTVRPAAGANGLVITNSTATPTIYLNGATYVTIDGLPGGVGGTVYPNVNNLAIINTSTAVNSTAIKIANDASNNTIRNCDIQGSNSTNTTQTECGVVFIGSTNVPNGLGNDNNTINACFIHGAGSNLPAIGVYSYGYTGSSISTASTFNDNNTIHNCSIYDFFSASAQSTGLKLDGGTNAWTITSNNFFQTGTRTYTTGNQHRAIWVTPSNGGGGNGFTISNNFIGGSAPSTAGSDYTMTGASTVASNFWAIDVSVIGSVASIPATPTVINGNTFRYFNLTTGATTANDYLRFISLGNTGSVNITNNVMGASSGITSITVNNIGTATGTIGGFGIKVGNVGTCSISGNQLRGMTFNATGNYPFQFTGIYVSGGTSIGITNNTIGSNTPTNGITMPSAATLGGSTGQALTGIHIAGGAAITGISGNTIANLRNAYTGTNAAGQVRGIAITSSTPTLGTGITNNTIRNLSNAATQTGVAGSAAVVGIAQASTQAGGCNVTGNVVDSLVATAATAGVNVNGLTYGGTASVTNTISKNFIHSLYTSSNSTSAYITGMDISGGTNLIMNNMVALGMQPGGTSNTNPTVLRGIFCNTTSTTKVYYNSVYIGGTGAANNNSTFAFNRNATSGTYDIRNNIFSNVRAFSGAPTGTIGNYAAYFTGSTTGVTLNNNLYQVSTASGSGGVVGYTGSAQQVAYAPGWVSSDVNSQSGDPLFIAPAVFGTGLDLHLTASANVAESGGVAIAGINDDYDGDIRQGSAGYAGSGTAPDLGADEFAGASVTPIVASTSINPTTANCTTSVARTITADITATGAAITGVQINYYVNGAAQTPVAMSLTSGTGAAGTTSTYTGTIPAVTPTNATVTWSVAATTGAASAASASASYADVPLGALNVLTATASATPICNGASTTLTGLFTNAAASYTAPPVVTYPATDEDLGTVKVSQGATTIFENITTNGSLTGTIGTGTGTGGSYGNFTAFGPYTLKLGQAYTLTATVLQPGSAYGNFVAAWIDYNHDGDFVDAGENIYVSPTSTTGGHTETASFTVPATAALGKVRMRVLSKESATPTSDPTQTVAYGEYEEYMLNILPANITYSWSDGTSAIGTTNPVTTTPVNNTNSSAVINYTATLNDATSGCSVTTTPAAVTVGPSITAPTGTNSAHCGSQVPTASVSDPNGMAGALFKWYAASTGGTPLQSSTANTYGTAVSTTTTFYVSVGDPVSGCESARTAVTVTVSQPDAVSITAPLHVCKGAAVPLSVTQTGSSNNYTFTWSAAPSANSGVAGTPTGATQSFTPTVGGTYVYTVTAVDGGCVATASASVDVLDLSASTFAATSPGCNTNANTPGTIAVSAMDVVPTTNTTVYSNNFTSATLTPQASLAGAGASITGGLLQLTPNTGSTIGGFEVLNSATSPNPNAGLTVNYDFTTTGTADASGGADGMSWSFGDDVVPTPTATAADGTVVGPAATNAENGSGTKLKVAFDAYGTGGGGLAGIYVMYNNPVVNQGTTVNSTMLAYSNNVTWKGAGTTKPISIQIDNTGKLTVKIAGVSIPGVTNIQLPAAYLSANKSTWKHEFSARTGGVSMSHQLDNLSIVYNTQPYTYQYSIDGTTYQASSAFTPNPGTYPVYISYASGECAANLGNAVIAPAPLIPTISTTPANPAYCGAGTPGTVLTASGADTYTWTPATALSATTGASVTATPATTTTYTVTGTTTAGCTNTKNVTVAAVSVTNATATPSTVCSGSPSQLQVNATPIISAYCVPGTSNGTFHWVQSFSVAAGATPLITSNNSGVAAAPRYTDYGTTRTTGNAVAGTTYTISAVDATTTTDYGAITIFIDYNQDGTFDLSERIYNIYDAANLTSPYSGTFVIPATAFNGTTKLRIRCDWAMNPTTGCQAYNQYGETEDYTINITGGTPNTSASYAWTPSATLNNAAIGNPIATPVSVNPSQIDTAIYDVTVTYGSCSVIKHDTVYVRPTGQWLGITNNWNTGTNWCGGVPTASSNAIIPSALSVPFSPVIATGNTGTVNNIQLNNSSILTVSNGATLNLNGNVMMNGTATFDATGSTVNFTGSAAQTILPDFTVSTLSVSGGSTKTLAGDVNVSSALNFSGGMIDVGANTLTMGSGATISGAGSSSYVRTSVFGGSLAQQVGSTPVAFPVGNGSYNPATITNAGAADVYFVGVRDQVQQEGTSGSQIDATTTYVVDHTWDIEEAQPGGSNVTLSLQWNSGETNSTSFDYSHVYISHYGGSGWDNPYPYAFMAPAATGAGPYTATRSGISSFSPFAIGSAGGSAPLPVKLVRLSATNEGSRNKVEWESATEHDLASYIVERSTDGKSFVQMNEVNAAGKAQGYITYDNQPAQGLTYYRLKMVDLSGAFVYSQTVKAFMGRSGEVVVTAQPNPLRDVLTVNVYGAQDGQAQLTDVSGRVVSSAAMSNGQATFNTGALSAGTYFVKWSNGAASQTVKVTKQ